MYSQGIDTTKRLTLVLFIIVSLTGCSRVTRINTQNIADSVPYAANLDPLVGRWAKNGVLALIVERNGDQITVRNPADTKWRLEISDATVSESTIEFTLKSFLIDGTSGPLDGVPFETTISPTVGDRNSLTYAFSQPAMTELQYAFFTRLPDDG